MQNAEDTTEISLTHQKHSAKPHFHVPLIDVLVEIRTTEEGSRTGHGQRQVNLHAPSAFAQGVPDRHLSFRQGSAWPVPVRSRCCFPLCSIGRSSERPWASLPPPPQHSRARAARSSPGTWVLPPPHTCPPNWCMHLHWSHRRRQRPQDAVNGQREHWGPGEGGEGCSTAGCVPRSASCWTKQAPPQPLWSPPRLQLCGRLGDRTSRPSTWMGIHNATAVRHANTKGRQCWTLFRGLLNKRPGARPQRDVNQGAFERWTPASSPLMPMNGPGTAVGLPSATVFSERPPVQLT